MPSLEAKRTLVKSPPEIWAEVSDAGALARHLGEFGEIRITRTQPESVVEWEGDLASGCVRLEPSARARRRARRRGGRPARPEPSPQPGTGTCRAEAKRSFWESLPAPPRSSLSPRLLLQPAAAAWSTAAPAPDPVRAEAGA